MGRRGMQLPGAMGVGGLHCFEGPYSTLPIPMEQSYRNAIKDSSSS